MRLIHALDALVDDLVLRFKTWAEDLDGRSRSGEFGKYPWQKQYGLWPWQRSRKP